jgi:hypothetical protein
VTKGEYVRKLDAKLAVSFVIGVQQENASKVVVFHVESLFRWLKFREVCGAVGGADLMGWQ